MQRNELSMTCKKDFPYFERGKSLNQNNNIFLMMLLKFLTLI